MWSRVRGYVGMYVYSQLQVSVGCLSSLLPTVLFYFKFCACVCVCLCVCVTHSSRLHSPEKNTEFLQEQKLSAPPPQHHQRSKLESLWATVSLEFYIQLLWSASPPCLSIYIHLPPSISLFVCFPLSLSLRGQGAPFWILDQAQMAPNTKFKPKKDPLLSKKERDWVDESEEADITDKGGVCDRACWSVMIGHLGHCSQIKYFDS